MICERCKKEIEENLPFCPFCGLRFKSRNDNDNDGTVIINPEMSAINLNSENTVIVNNDDNIGGFDNSYSDDSETTFLSSDSVQALYVNPIVNKNNDNKTNENHIQPNMTDLQFNRKNYIPFIVSAVILVIALLIFIKLVIL